jgi:hypothetical protein
VKSLCHTYAFSVMTVADVVVVDAAAAINLSVPGLNLIPCFLIEVVAIVVVVAAVVVKIFSC